MPDLQFSTTEEIVDELASRFQGVLVATIAPAKNSPRSEEFSAYYRGGFTLCYGMAGRLYSKMRDESNEKQVREEGDGQPS